MYMLHKVIAYFENLERLGNKFTQKVRGLKLELNLPIYLVSCQLIGMGCYIIIPKSLLLIGSSAQDKIPFVYSGVSNSSVMLKTH